MDDEKGKEDMMKENMKETTKEEEMKLMNGVNDDL